MALLADAQLRSEHPARVALSATWSSPAVRVLVVGALLALPLVALSIADAAGLRGLWDNLHWCLTALAAAIASILAVRGSVGRVRPVRIGGAIAFGIWLLTNVTWAVLNLTGAATIPSIADVLVLSMIFPAAGVLVATVRGRMTLAEQAAVYLDSVLAMLLVASILIVVHGSSATELPPAGAVLALAYPTLFIGLGIAGVIALIAGRYAPLASGGFAISAGSIVIGLAYLGWIVPTATGGFAGSVPSILFSLGTIVAAFGLVTWRDADVSSPRYEAAARHLSRVLAPVMAATLFLTLLAPTTGLVETLLRISVFAGGLLFVIRQALLLRERTGMLAEVTRLSHENDRLVGELRLELVRRERNQKGLIEASRAAAVGELAAGVAHEVNNPLTGVLGYAELALAAIRKDSPVRRDVETIRAEALRARAIVRALLDFARPREPELVETDLGDVVRQAVDLVRYPFVRRGLTLVEQYDPLPPLLIDPQAIQQAVLNVVTNAGQAVADDGLLEVAVRADGPDVLIRVADDGVGMDEETLAQVFVPFFAGPREGQREHIGLGLSVASGLIGALGGTIRLDSQPGRGTTVDIRLPVLDADRQTAVAGEGDIA